MKSFLVRWFGTGLVVIVKFGCYVLSGCTSVKKMVGLTTPDDEEVAREAKEAGSPAPGRRARPWS